MSRLRVLLAALVTLTTAFSGCVKSDEEADDPRFVLNRQVRLVVDETSLLAASDLAREGRAPDPYLFMTSSFVVGVRGSGIVPTEAMLTYMDREGAVVTRPLSEFTDKESLEPGDEVRVDDANLTSGAVLSYGGAEVANRARPQPDWWVVGGYPVGFSLSPGASLAYRSTAHAGEKLGLSDVHFKDEPIEVERADASIALDVESLLELSLAEAEESVTAESEHAARPLAWKLNGRVAVPVLVEAVGRNTTSGERVEAGVEVLPVTGAEFNAHGTLWMNGSRAPVRLDVAGGEARTDLDVIAWVTGAGINASTFSCAGKTRADACRPTEQDFSEARRVEPIEPDSENLDGAPWQVQPEVLRNLTTLLAEDLRPGDLLSILVQVDSRNVDDYEPGPTDPRHVVIDYSAELKAVDVESVTVGAGTFQALKIIESMRVFIEVGEVPGEDGRAPFRGITIDQQVVDATLWLEEGTFVPLRVEQSTPLDIGRILGDALASVDASFWEDAPLEPLDADDVRWTSENRMSVELVRKEGDVSFSPWLVIFGFNGVWGSLGLGYAGGLSGLAAPRLDEEAPWNLHPPGEESFEGSEGGFFGSGKQPSGPTMIRESFVLRESGGPSDAMPWSVEPGTMHVPNGSFVEITVLNEGELAHRLVFPDLPAESGDVPPGEIGFLHFVANAPGVYEYYCDIPGHRDLGQHGVLVVGE